jgi:triacylglycerol lipase
MMYYPRGFDRRRAIEAAELINQAYAQLSAFKNGEAWSLQGGYTLVRQLQYPRAEAADPRGPVGRLDVELRTSLKARLGNVGDLPIGFIAASGADVFLVFRGTMTTAEWLKDLSIRLAPYRYGVNGNVHEGFARTYGIFRDSIHSALRDLKTGGRLLITGHSLGAGLATLCAPDIATNARFKAPFVYTYGSPRVGDKTFAAGHNELLRDRSFRIANTCDVVTSVPFPSPVLGFLGGYFTHVDTPVDFTTQAEDSEKNHDMGTYIAALKGDAGRKGLLGALFGRA